MRDQVVIVTGAGNGIGLSIFNQLLASPSVSHVIGVDMVMQQLEEVQKQHPDRVHLVVGDVSLGSTNQEAVDTALKHGGHIDNLILNAAMVKPIGPLAKLAISDWKAAFGVNFFGPLDMIQRAWDSLLETEGNILLTSTRVCLQPAESWTCYASTKSVLNYLCSCIPLETSRIKSLTITPGAVDTDSQTKLRNDKNTSPAMQRFLQGLKKDYKLLHPDQPASAFVKMVEAGIPSSMNGRTVNWDVVLVEAKGLNGAQ